MLLFFPTVIRFDEQQILLTFYTVIFARLKHVRKWGQLKKMFSIIFTMFSERFNEHPLWEIWANFEQGGSIIINQPLQIISIYFNHIFSIF